MANVKTAISLAPELMVDVDALAHELNVSRSRVFTMAVEKLLKQYENKRLLAAINKAYEDNPLSEEELAHLQAMQLKQRELLKDEEW